MSVCRVTRVTPQFPDSTKWTLELFPHIELVIESPLETVYTLARVDIDPLPGLRVGEDFVSGWNRKRQYFYIPLILGIN